MIARFALLALAALTLQAPLDSTPPGLIPAPATLEQHAGELSVARIVPAEEPPAPFAEVVARQLAELFPEGSAPMAAGSGAPAAWLRVLVDDAIPAEGYTLQTAATGIEIRASTAAGVFYAFQTLRQLQPAATAATTATRTPAPGAIEPAASGGWKLPSVSIVDAPRFPYRGMHLDVGRHFFPVEVVKKYIDTIARFKLNRLHWHLTEDQGWRVQIDAYPKLTEVGAWRAETPVDKNLDPYVGDGTPHGGFYTKAEIRDIVAYAAERFVTVVPEIEMPGHATAAIAAYPELGCTDERLEVSTTWGVHDTIFCPHEATFEFLETVLTEVMELFPSEYVHIGGDEVPKRQWRESEVAQAIIRREGLADEDELQSWFIRRIERHLRTSGRRLIGWDEILQGGLAPDATVMSWRGTEGGIEAARQGHDVIMTPIEHTYFDFYQADPATEPLAMHWAGFAIPLETVYAFEPVPEALAGAEAARILGAQGNVWTEYVSTPEYLEYMAFPRALALAEVVWSPAAARDWNGFVSRLGPALAQLDALGVHYRFPSEVLAAPGTGERQPSPTRSAPARAPR